MKDHVIEVEIDNLRVSPFQPRRHFAKEDLEELVASIQSVGLIHPPVVREIKAADKVLYYELIAGERRWRACQMAGFQTIPILVKATTDALAAKATLIENVQRVDLDPVELALAYKRLIDVFGMTQEDVAKQVGKKRSTISNYLRLLTLSDEMKQALSEKAMTMGHAKALLSLDSPEMKDKLHNLIKDKKLTVRQAEKESASLTKKKKPVTAPKKKVDPHIAEFVQLLEDRLNTKVEITTQGKQGKVAIHFYSQEDLEQLVAQLAQSRQPKTVGSMTTYM